MLPLWQDRPGSENADVAAVAAAAGYAEVWIGEMATYDAFSLATAVGASCDVTITIGPLAAGLRTPTAMAMGVASVADLTGRPVRLAIGSSSPFVVSRWHGRPWSQTARRLDETAVIARHLLDGGRTDHDGDTAASHGYRLRLDPPGAHLTVAAFGPRALDVAAARADRVVFNMVTVDTAARLVERVRHAAADHGRRPPSAAVWLTAAVDPTPADHRQLASGRVGYLAAPGYGEMLTEAGFGELVTLARSGAHPREVAGAIPPELDDVVGVAGSAHHIADRIAAYGEAGIDEVCLVPATAGDASARRTLESLAPGTGGSVDGRR